ncbi:hypothetical protein BGZ76_008894 [Entomortierella beljakovae]|nr:hypothetical protein BGZ76_008894 [Entomortierella beljakovae]
MWIISTFILLIIFVANYADTILLLAWTPKLQNFTIPIEIDLSNTYNAPIPYDIYQQYTVNGTINPDAMLDSRYNPMLAHAIVSPGSIFGEQISYFTISFDSTTALNNDRTDPACAFSERSNKTFCSGTNIVVSTPCDINNVTGTDFDRKTEYYVINDCAPVLSTMDASNWMPKVLVRLGSVSDIKGIELPDVDVSPISPTVLTSESVGVETLHRVRLLSTPYTLGRGLLLQYEMEDSFVLQKNNDGKNLWLPSECERVLGGYGFANVTTTCSKPINSTWADARYLFISTTENYFENTMVYCIVYDIFTFTTLQFVCGRRYFKVSYLGTIPALGRDWIGCNAPVKGSTDIWCWVDGEGYRLVEFDDPKYAFRTLSSRGFGGYNEYDKMAKKSQVSHDDFDSHVQSLQSSFNTTYEMFLREYYLGSDNLLRGGVKATGVGYVTMNLYSINIALLTTVIVFSVAFIIVVLVLNYFILPSYYLSSALDVFRKYTAANYDDIKQPENVDQIIILKAADDNTVVLTNNGSRIGIISDKYGLAPIDRREPLLGE